MAAEPCGICGDRVSFDDTVHVLVHTREDGVRDQYVCRSCYEERVEPLFE